MGKIILRFVNEDDELDAQIRRDQYGFWASHVEAIVPDSHDHHILRYDDREKRWGWIEGEDDWHEECVVEIPVTDEQQSDFYWFLNMEVQGKRYDMRAIAGVQYDLASHKRDRWNCSDPIYWALVTAQVFKTLAPGLWYVTARDIMLALSAVMPIPPIRTRIERTDT